jgi:hypothetical protein
MDTLQVRAGQVIGRDHLLRQANCQDGYALLQTDQHIVGIVCDGCGDGQYSEVGAKLAANYLAGQAVDLLGRGHDIQKIPDLLYRCMTSYLEDLICLTQPRDRLGFLRHHLLFTIVGVILSESGGVIFTAGDGIYAIDGSLRHIDQDNQPMYIAYRLVDPTILGGLVVPNQFDVEVIPADWQRVMIASDGLEVDLVPQVWQLSHPRGLQRKLNLWSNQEHRLRDDTTVITVEKVSQDASDNQ